MANFSALKTAIQNAIRQNGNEEITGDVLQQILLSVVNTMGDGAINTIEQNLSNETLARQNADNTLQQNINSEAGARRGADNTLQSHIDAEALARGNADTQLQNAINAIKADIDNGYVYAGIATPSSTPVSGKVFYIATAAGTYTNFGGQVLTQGINILRFNGSAWSNQQLIGIDDEPTQGSNNLVKSGGVLKSIIQNGPAFDLSAYNAVGGVLATYADLSDALTALNALDAAYKQPGMSFKFVRTSDNKYIRYNLLADSFTTDTTQWAIDDAGVYVENPEFIYVKTDAENKILWAIRTDGDIFYGAGVPQQVIDYIEEKISDLSPDEYEDIVAFLDDLEKGDKTLQTLLNEKVNKEEGKSLIDVEYANGVHYIENPEFVKIVTDNEGKILYAVKTDGSFVFGAGVPQQIIDYVNALTAVKVDKEIGKSLIPTQYIQEIENPEFLTACIDTTGKVICGIKKEGSVYIANIDSPTIQKILSDFRLQAEGLDDVNERVALLEETFHNFDNPEWIKVVVDSNNKIIEGITLYGRKKINIPIDIDDNCIESKDIPEFVKVIVDKDKKILLGIEKDGNIYFGKTPKQLIDYTESTINKVKSNRFYFQKYGLSPLIEKNESKPVIYRSNKWMQNAITYPDGTIFYAGNTINKIMKILPDGTETYIELFSTEISGSFRMLWMDSELNLYASPNISDSQYSEYGGLYKIAYNENTATHVLKLYDPNSSVQSEQEPNTFTIWTATEDAEGNLYAGVYGQPYCPYIYKSTDGGDTWFFLKDMSVYAPGGIHIHFIKYNEYDNCLYCTVGEINKLLKSVDGGVNWIDMNVTLEKMKSCSIHCVEDGIILGSDYGYWAMMYKVYPDGSYRTTAKTIANAIFSIRESDVTGWLYAFGVIDAATHNLNWYPPVEALTDPAVLQSWKNSNPTALSSWQEYYDSMINIFPEDAIIPQHSIILISKDRGETWKILYRMEGQSSGVGGYFRNGECALSVSNGNDIIISEGKHKYVDGGVDIDGEIFSKFLASKIVNIIL